MVDVLVIGLDPYRVPGPWDPEPVATGIARGMAELAERGHRAETCLFGLDGSDDPTAVVAAALTTGSWDVVVIGGGVRGDEERLEQFEAIVNLVHRHAPGAAIAFNATVDDIADAVARWVD